VRRRANPAMMLLAGLISCLAGLVAFGLWLLITVIE
jgi:hypothetical protein